MAGYGPHFATAASTQITLQFPNSVTARQRAVLHAVATTHGVCHQSNGDGDERRIALGVGTEVVYVRPETIADDDDICDLLAVHLQISPDVSKRAFVAPAPRPEKRGIIGGRDGTQSTESSDPLVSSSSAAPHVSLERANIDVTAFVHKTLESLELERVAEAEQNDAVLKGLTPSAAQKKGRALLGLKCVDQKNGFYGKTIVVLELASRPTGDNKSPPLPPHKLTPHDIVCLRPNKADNTTGTEEPLCSGVVYRVRDTRLEIAVDETPDSLDGTLRVERLQNETSHNRLVDALRLVGKASSGGVGVDLTKFPGARLVEYLFGNTAPRTSASEAFVLGDDVDTIGDVTRASSFVPINKNLDQSQFQAVAHALRSHDVALIHGPPGTGKTTAVVEYVLQELSRGNRVVCCAASNVAVDTLVERIVMGGDGFGVGGVGGGGTDDTKSADESTGTKSMGKRRVKKSKSSSVSESNLIRLGHPARLLPSVLRHSLEAVVSRSDDSGLAKDCEKECEVIRKRLAKLTGRISKEERAERFDARKELRKLQKETKQRQKKAIDVVVGGAKLICCTLSGALTGAIRNETFDVVVIDEAAQALEPACWGAIFKGKKTVLAGDHKQLPPTVLSKDAATRGLGETLFARVHAKWPSTARILTTQYRMHGDISRWASEELYEGRLVAADGVAQRVLRVGTFESGGYTCECCEGEHHTSSTHHGDPSTVYPNFEADEQDPTALPPLVLVDTAGCDFTETREHEGDSVCNPGEVGLAIAIARRLIAAGAVTPEELGVVAPYSAQVGLLREQRALDDSLTKVEMSTVDGFQGREKDAIILTATRSNEKGDVGFLADVRRMNVAVTRARKHVVLICDTDTVGRHDPFLRRLVSHFEAHGLYVGAGEFSGEG